MMKHALLHKLFCLRQVKIQLDEQLNLPPHSAEHEGFLCTSCFLALCCTSAPVAMLFTNSEASCCLKSLKHTHLLFSNSHTITDTLSLSHTQQGRAHTCEPALRG